MNVYICMCVCVWPVSSLCRYPLYVCIYVCVSRRRRSGGSGDAFDDLLGDDDEWEDEDWDDPLLALSGEPLPPLEQAHRPQVYAGGDPALRIRGATARDEDAALRRQQREQERLEEGGDDSDIVEEEEDQEVSEDTRAVEETLRNVDYWANMHDKQADVRHPFSPPSSLTND